VKYRNFLLFCDQQGWIIHEIVDKSQTLDISGFGFFVIFKIRLSSTGEFIINEKKDCKITISDIYWRL